MLSKRKPPAPSCTEMSRKVKKVLICIFPLNLPFYCSILKNVLFPNILIILDQSVTIIKLFNYIVGFKMAVDVVEIPEGACVASFLI